MELDAEHVVLLDCRRKRIRRTTVVAVAAAVIGAAYECVK